MSRLLVFATAISLVVTACAGTEAETTGATQPATTAEPTTRTIEATGTTQPPSVTESVATTTTLPSPLPEIEMDRVAHGPWFEGVEGVVLMTSVTAGGPGLVAAGAAGNFPFTDAAVWTSPDGHTWARVDHDPSVFGNESSVSEADSAQIISDLISGSLGLVAVGADGRPSPDDYDAAVWLSTDGLAWERLPHDEEVFGGIGDQFMRSIVQTSGTAVVVGESAGQATVWVSRDGRQWTRARIDGASGDTGTEPTAMFDVAVGGPGLVAVGSVGFESRPAVWLSVDGATWNRLPDSISGGSSGVEGAESTPGRMTLVAAGDEGLIAIAATAGGDWSFAKPAVWTSIDGFEWRMLDAEFLDVPTATWASLGDIAWDGDRLVAVGGYQATDPGWQPGITALWVSLDGGMTWQVGSEKDVAGWAPAPVSMPPGHLTRFGSVFVVAGNETVPTDPGYMQYASVWIASLAEG